MKVLIIEDSTILAESIKKALQASYYNVDIACDGKSGSYIARTNKYKIILLDLILPEKDGVTDCKEIREAGVECPILVISTQSEVPDKVSMLKMGADDYITKPFNIDELTARMEALLRRPYKIKKSVFTLNEVTIDIAKQSVQVDGEEIYLTRKEYMLLSCLIENEGNVVTRGKILEEVWDKDCNPFTNTIETHVRNLRKKIETGGKKLIYTVSGRGYRLIR